MGRRVFPIGIVDILALLSYLKLPRVVSIEPGRRGQVVLAVIRRLRQRHGTLDTSFVVVVAMLMTLQYLKSIPWHIGQVIALFPNSPFEFRGILNLVPTKSLTFGPGFSLLKVA